MQFGTVRGSYIPALLQLLSGVFAPQIFANTIWPESIRNHFASHLHRFLACLTGEQKALSACSLSGAALTVEQTRQVGDSSQAPVRPGME